MARLGDVFTIASGGTPNKKNPEYYEGGTIPWVKTGDLKGRYVPTGIECITEEGLNNSSAKLFPRNTVLVAMYGATIGACSILPYEAATNQACAAFLPNENVLPEYLYYFLCSKREQFVKDGVGGAQPNISAGYLKNVVFNTVSLQHQHEIVRKMRKIEGLISLRKEQLAKLDELVKARFVEMFGDPITNPIGWPVHQLSEYIQFLTSGSRGWAQYFTEEGEYFITIKNVKNCRITLDAVQHIVPPNNVEAARTKVQEGDLLISITADLGRTGVVTRDIAEHGAYINQHLTCIRLDKSALNPLYVAYYMESEAGKEQFQSKNQTGVKAGLNFNAINSLRLFVPSLELQEKFTVFVEQTEKTKLTLQESLGTLEVMKKALMQEYFG